MDQRNDIIENQITIGIQHVLEHAIYFQQIYVNSKCPKNIISAKIAEVRESVNSNKSRYERPILEDQQSLDLLAMEELRRVEYHIEKWDSCFYFPKNNFSGWLDGLDTCPLCVGPFLPIRLAYGPTLTFRRFTCFVVAVNVFMKFCDSLYTYKPHGAMVTLTNLKMLQSFAEAIDNEDYNLIQSITKKAVFHMFGYFVIPSSSSDSSTRDYSIVKCDSTRDDQRQVCSICLVTLHVGENLVRLPCSHLFHKPCVVKWLSKTRTCPLCREWVKRFINPKTIHRNYNSYFGVRDLQSYVQRRSCEEMKIRKAFEKLKYYSTFPLYGEILIR